MLVMLANVRDHRHRTAGATDAGEERSKHLACQRVGVRWIALFALLDFWQRRKWPLAVHQGVGKALSKCLLDLDFWPLLIIAEKPDHGVLIGITFLNCNGIRVIVTPPQLENELPVPTGTIRENKQMEDVTTLGEEG